METLTLQKTSAETALISGDLSQLTPEQRLNFYTKTCQSLGLNPWTKPFEYINLKGKLTLYAKKDATEQLRKLHRVSLKIISRERIDGCYVVTAQASLPDGRIDESLGAVSIEKTNNDEIANAIMKAETKAKRRVTLSICGLGFLDETELETIPSAQHVTITDNFPSLPPQQEPTEDEKLIAEGDKLLAHLPPDHVTRKSWDWKKKSLKNGELKKAIEWIKGQIQKASESPISDEDLATYHQEEETHEHN